MSSLHNCDTCGIIRVYSLVMRPSTASQTEEGNSISVITYNEAVDGIALLAIEVVPVPVNRWFESQA